LKGCEQVQDLFFNFGTQSSKSTIMIPNDTLEGQYIADVQLRAYTVELAIFLPLTTEANDDGNIAMLERIDAIGHWIVAQARGGNIPEFPDNCRIDSIEVSDSVAGYAVAQNGVIAKYVLPFVIHYTKHI
jgi:hypothetical protein